AHFQVAREDDTDATHLPGDVGEGDEDHADHGDQPCGLGVIALTNEVRHGELAELAQVGRQAHGQQHITAGPAHQVDRTIVTGESDNPGHGNEGRRGHPVGTGGHAVEYRVYALAGH